MSIVEKSKRPVDLVFPQRREAFEKATCLAAPIGCGKAIGPFKDEVSSKEYAISGLCQHCQDSIFGEDFRPERT